MNENLYRTQIDEIDGEIASLKMALKRTSDRARSKEIKEDIKYLEEQREMLAKRWNGNKEFRERYRSKKDLDKCLVYQDESEDGYLGPNGDGITHEEY